MDRQQIGGWLSGPPTTPLEPGEYRGSRLGLPEDGVGSLAGFGRRLLALVVDWALAIFIGLLVVPDVEYGDEWSPVVTLVTFFVMVTLLTWVAGGSIGQRLLGLQVVRAGGGPVGLWRSFVRIGLLCLVIPAVVWDRDGRGLHDKAAGTALLRAR